MKKASIIPMVPLVQSVRTGRVATASLTNAFTEARFAVRVAGRAVHPLDGKSFQHQNKLIRDGLWAHDHRPKTSREAADMKPRARKNDFICTQGTAVVPRFDVEFVSGLWAYRP